MSTIKVDTIKNTSNVEVYTCKAWVNFDGTQTAASMIRGSGNVTSITDNGTGVYTVNFANAMPDTNYTTLITNDNGSSAIVRYTTTTTIATGSYKFATREGTSGTSQNGALQDQQYIRVAIFR